MDLNKNLLLGMIICMSIIVAVSIQPYILGIEPISGTGTIVKVFSVILGVLFVVGIAYIMKNKIWRKYKGISLFVFILGMCSVAFLLFTAFLVGSYSGFIPISIDFPKAIDQSLIPLRTISIYFAIAGILMLLSLIISESKSKA